MRYSALTGTTFRPQTGLSVVMGEHKSSTNIAIDWIAHAQSAIQLWLVTESSLKLKHPPLQDCEIPGSNTYLTQEYSCFRRAG